ncbi:MAG: ABC transporter ATP-binding protein [Thiobacillus sp.]|nr:ABC transporter ATP-binding protein [Thiobacillus sp.]
MTDIAISIHNVSKRYHVYENQRARLRHALWPSSKDGVSEVWALQDINFEVKRGDSVAIIGRNGSGKSTLLEIITQTLTPTTGKVQVNGRVAALLELGSGFKPDYTGRENVFLNGLLLGLTRAEIERRYDEILSFADIGDVLDRPVKTYSSGMLVRLAFAVQVALEPDILIVDEALSVGDYFFQQKCFGRLRQMREDGLSLLFVSHDMNTVTNICDRAVYLRKGELCFDGDPHQAVRAYLAQTENKLHEIGSQGLGIGAARPSPVAMPEAAAWRRPEGDFPTGGGLLAICILNAGGEATTGVHIGAIVRVQVYFVPDPLDQAHIYLQLKNRFDQIVCTTGTYYLNLPIVELQPKQVALAEFELVMNLGGGGYSFLVSMAYPEPPNRLGKILAYTEAIGPITVECQYHIEKAPFLGPFGLPVTACLRQTSLEK